MLQPYEPEVVSKGAEKPKETDSGAPGPNEACPSPLGEPEGSSSVEVPVLSQEPLNREDSSLVGKTPQHQEDNENEVSPTAGEDVRTVSLVECLRLAASGESIHGKTSMPEQNKQRQNTVSQISSQTPSRTPSRVAQKKEQLPSALSSASEPLPLMEKDEKKVSQEECRETEKRAPPVAMEKKRGKTEPKGKAEPKQGLGLDSMQEEDMEFEDGEEDMGTVWLSSLYMDGG